MNKLAILEPEDFNPKALDLLSNYFDIVYGIDFSASAIFCRFKYELNCTFLSRFVDLRFICSPTTGHTHIDEEFCNSNDISICSLRNCMEQMHSIHSTSEFTILMILSLLRNFHLAINSSSTLASRMDFRGNDLSSQTVGILGVGRIGRHVYDYLCSFGCNIVCWDCDRSKLEYVAQDHRVGSLNELLSKSTILTLHANEQPNKAHILGLSELSILPVGSLIVNTARASLISKHSLCSLIKNSHIAGYASDVFWDEYSNVLDIQLDQMRSHGYNIIMTPHIGGCTLSSMQQTEMFVAQYLLSKLSYA